MNTARMIYEQSMHDIRFYRSNSALLRLMLAISTRINSAAVWAALMSSGFNAETANAIVAANIEN